MKSSHKDAKSRHKRVKSHKGIKNKSRTIQMKIGRNEACWMKKIIHVI